MCNGKTLAHAPEQASRSSTQIAGKLFTACRTCNALGVNFVLGHKTNYPWKRTQVNSDHQTNIGFGILSS
jgi:hypothetical protein